MEQIIQEIINKKIEVDGEIVEVPDYTMQYTYDVQTILVDEEEQEQRTLIKTERIDSDGTWLITKGEGCINQCLITPSQKYIDEHPVIPTPKSPLEILQETVDQLVLDSLGV